MELLQELLSRINAFMSQVVYSGPNTSLTVSALLVVILGFYLLWVFSAICEKSLLAKFGASDPLAPASQIKRRIAFCLRCLLLFVGSLVILDASEFDVTAAQILAAADAFLNMTIMQIGKTQVRPWTIIYVMGLFTALIFASNRLQHWCSETVLSRSGMEIGARHATSVILKYLAISLGFVVILQSAGVDLSALTVMAGALGLGLSFGLQNITSNLVSGLIVLIERPIKVGDRIEVANVIGEVKKIALRATTICSNDNIEIIVPNSEFISGTVINWSHSSRDVRISVPVGVSYNSDPEQVKKILMDVAAQNQAVLKDPEPIVLFKGFGESSLDFVLRVSTREFTFMPAQLQSQLNFAIFKEFKNKGVEIPFPQRDLHIRSSGSLLTGHLQESGDARKVAETGTGKTSSKAERQSESVSGKLAPICVDANS